MIPGYMTDSDLETKIRYWCIFGASFFSRTTGLGFLCSDYNFIRKLIMSCDYLFEDFTNIFYASCIHTQNCGRMMIVW